MRTTGVAALVLCALTALQPSAIGQEACGPGKLGVARTATIDGTESPSFGLQYASRGGKPLLANGEVVLTFDDGPSRGNTRSVLAALAEQCTRATFFMVGRRALSDPETVREVARRGHTVATHTWSHANLQRLPEDKVQAEIELGLSAVQQALGKPVSPFFRFPYLRDTAFSRRHLSGRQIAAFSIDIDSRDFEIRETAALRQRVIGDLAARRKGIILFHDIHASTARALPGILADIKARGFRVVHLAPKAGAETVAAYDALVQRESDRKRLATARNPLAERAIAWPLTGLPEARADAKLTAAPPPAEPPAPAAAPPAHEDWTTGLWDRTY